VHRLRKRIDDHYQGKDGPRLTIPKGEYRIVLEEVEPTERRSALSRGLAGLSRINPALGIGLFVIACATAVLIGWNLLSTSPTPASGQPDDRQALLAASSEPFKPLIVVGDSLLLAETQDQRSVRRMILNPAIRSRDDFGAYLRANPDAFYQLYDFDLNFAPISAIEAAWEVQGKLDALRANDAPAIRMIGVSALSAELRETQDILFVGRLSQLGVLEPEVFSGSRFRLAAYDRLVDTANGPSFQGQVYPDERLASQKDYGYLAVRTSATGRRLVVLGGLGDKATAAIVALLNTPHEMAVLKRKVRGARHFEAVYEVEIRRGGPAQRKLIAAYPLP
ncbi:MAG: hypothetical protein KJ752_14730, partial [Alphaproteobacteria bacterium]|nr:hypothetical protein [Alphaproteobacteria bacterium]